MNNYSIFWLSTLFCNTFSAVGSLFIILSIAIRFRRDLNSRVVAYLSVADFNLAIISFCFNLNYFIQGETSISCYSQAVLTWWMLECSILWLAVIALNSYKVAFHSEPLSHRQEVGAHLICCGLPLITSILPLIPGIGERYGSRDGYWCSFSASSRPAQVINLAMYFTIAFVIIVFCYVRTSREVHLRVGRGRSNSVSRRHVQVIKRMSYFVLLYLLVWSPLLICYIYEAVSDRFVPFWAEEASMILVYLHGLFNFTLYGYTSDLGRNWINWIRVHIIGLAPLPDENNTGTSMPNTPVPSQSRYGSRSMTPSHSAGSIKKDLEENISLEVVSESPKSISVVTFADDLRERLEKEQSQE